MEPAIDQTTGVQTEQHRKFLVQSTIVENVARVIVEVIRWSGLCVIAYYAAQTIQSLAGKHTLAQIGIGFFSDVRVSETVAWIFGIGGTGYGLSQRRLLKRTHSQMGTRMTSLEKRIDPKRTSSHLTREGDTRPEEK